MKSHVWIVEKILQKTRSDGRAKCGKQKTKINNTWTQRHTYTQESFKGELYVTAQALGTKENPTKDIT